MIILFSDFGLEGPYIGQVKAVLHLKAPETVVIDLFADAPVYNPKASAYLLGAYAKGFPQGSIFLSIVDPGVGSARRALVIRIADQWYVGPDNGLAEFLMRWQKGAIEAWEILWKPENCSASFHGRDVFSPVAARLAVGDTPDLDKHEQDFRRIDSNTIRRPDWPDDLAKIIYFDRFGNAMTGIRAEVMKEGQTLRIDDYMFPVAQTFTDVDSGDMFCYANANGLMEIAVNKGRAKDIQGLTIGKGISIN